MHTNNPKEKITINKEGVIYSLIFVLYAAIIVLVFIYATKFLSKNINIALSTPISSEITAKYGQLDLENYALLASKLGLKKSTITNAEILLPIVTEATSTLATSSEITATTTPEIIAPVITPELTEVKPIIVINNSTNKSGLAAQLKNKFSAINYTILRTGNIKPSLPKTIIRTDLDANSQYLTEIKKIVAIDYDFVLENLTTNPDYNVEIIIGNK